MGTYSWLKKYMPLFRGDCLFKNKKVAINLDLKTCLFEIQGATVLKLFDVFEIFPGNVHTA